MVDGEVETTMIRRRHTIGVLDREATSNPMEVPTNRDGDLGSGLVRREEQRPGMQQDAWAEITAIERLALAGEVVDGITVKEAQGHPLGRPARRVIRLLGMKARALALLRGDREESIWFPVWFEIDTHLQ